MDPRQVRGRLLAESQDKRIKHVEGPLWFVPSQREGGYLVNVAAGSCGCPDFLQHPTKCKHLWAVELVRGGGKTEAEGDAGTALVKAVPPRLGRMSDFTAQEQENIRRALRFMRIRSGGWGPLAKRCASRPAPSTTWQAERRSAPASLCAWPGSRASPSRT